MNTFSNTDSILIAGGTGFIGKHLALRCLNNTKNVTCIGLTHRDLREIRQAGGEIVFVDLCNKNELKSVLSNRAFDYVFNLGGYIDHTPYRNGGRKLIESHFTGLMNLIDCLDKERLKGFVQIGSSDEYGNSPAPQNESMRELPISPYSLAKTAASHFIQMISNTEGFPGVVLRLFLTYGPGQDSKRFLPQIINACFQNLEFKTSEGLQHRDFCYIDDVVDAMLMAVLCPDARGHIINIASGVPVPIREVVKKVVMMIGGGRPIWGAYPYRKGENMELYADINLAKSLLKWKPRVAFEDGLKKTIDYYRTLLKG